MGGGGGIRRPVTVFDIVDEDEADDVEARNPGERGVDDGDDRGRGEFKATRVASAPDEDDVEGRCGSLGGTDFCLARAFSQSREIICSVAGLAREVVETSS